MFSIKAITSKNEIIESTFYRRFEITIGSFKESFLSPLVYWSVDSYEKHWKENIRKFIFSKMDCTFLITEMYDPKYANFIRWWILYRNGEDVIFQEQVLFLEDVEGEFCLSSAHKLILPYQSINEDGEKISEWSIKISSLIEE
jgi:hypothetical protein